MTRRFLVALLLALILPLAQVAAAAHEVSHVKATPASIHCDQCATAAALGAGAAAADAPSIAPPVRETGIARPHAVSHITQPSFAFLSRAPPSLR